MKKIAAIMLSALLTIAFSVTCFAQEGPAQKEVIRSYTWQTEDGFTVVTTIEADLGNPRSSQRGSKTNQYYYDGAHVGTMVLNGEFYYDGSTARATGASKSYSTASGWSYSGGDAKTSGASVSVSGSFDSGSKHCAVDMTLTCSPSGALS